MNRLATVFCDDCGWPIECLADARVRLLTGRDSFDVRAALLVHGPTARPKCTHFERKLGGQTQTYDAVELLDARLEAAVKDLQSSRAVWSSVRTLLKRVRRLGRLALRAEKAAARVREAA